MRTRTGRIARRANQPSLAAVGGPIVEEHLLVALTARHIAIVIAGQRALGHERQPTAIRRNPRSQLARTIIHAASSLYYLRSSKDGDQFVRPLRCSRHKGLVGRRRAFSPCSFASSPVSTPLATKYDVTNRLRRRAGHSDHTPGRREVRDVAGAQRFDPPGASNTYRSPAPV